MKEKKEPKPKKPFMSGYRTYNPKKEGFGNPNQWREAFNVRMGLDEAKRVIKDRSPLAILGLNEMATWDEIDAAHRKLVWEFHPHRNFDKDASNRFQEIQAAYEVLEEKYGKGR